MSIGFESKSGSAAQTGPGCLPLVRVPARTRPAEALDPRRAHGRQQAPGLAPRRIPGATMEAHEGETGRVDGLLDGSRKTELFVGLQDPARTLILREVLHIGGQRLPAALEGWFLFGHQDLGLLLGDRMVTGPDAGVHLAAVLVLIVVL